MYSVTLAGLVFTPNADGFAVTRPYAGGEAIVGHVPIAALDKLREVYAKHQRDFVVPFNALAAAYKALCSERGGRFATKLLQEVANAHEISDVPRKQYASLTQTLIDARSQP